MLQLFPVDCVANVNGGNNSFSVDDWNYVVILKAIGNVTIKTSGGEEIGPLTQALGITTGEKVKKGVIQVVSDQTETVIIAFSGDGSRVTGFATQGSGGTIPVPVPVVGDQAEFTAFTNDPVVIGFSAGGNVSTAHSSDARGLDVKQYLDSGQNTIAGSGSLTGVFGASAMALVTVEVTTPDTGGAVTPSIEGITFSNTIQPQILDQNRAQVLSGASKFASGALPTINNIGDRVCFLIPADCLLGLTVHIAGVNNDGVVFVQVSASPMGAK